MQIFTLTLARTRPAPIVPMPAMKNGTEICRPVWYQFSSTISLLRFFFFFCDGGSSESSPSPEGKSGSGSGSEFDAEQMVTIELPLDSEPMSDFPFASLQFPLAPQDLRPASGFKGMFGLFGYCVYFVIVGRKKVRGVLEGYVLIVSLPAIWGKLVLFKTSLVYWFLGSCGDTYNQIHI